MANGTAGAFQFARFPIRGSPFGCRHHALPRQRLRLCRSARAVFEASVCGAALDTTMRCGTGGGHDPAGPDAVTARIHHRRLAGIIQHRHFDRLRVLLAELAQPRCRVRSTGCLGVQTVPVPKLRSNWLGVTPKENSSGMTRQLGRMSKRARSGLSRAMARSAERPHKDVRPGPAAQGCAATDGAVPNRSVESGLAAVRKSR